jgi:Ca2+-dependent lipid-binding protein
MWQQDSSQHMQTKYVSISIIFPAFLPLNLNPLTSFLVMVTESLSPEWNETFQFMVDDPLNQYLYCRVMDWDRIGKNSSMGWVKIPLKEVTQSGYLQGDFKLEGIIVILLSSSITSIT